MSDTTRLVYEGIDNKTTRKASEWSDTIPLDLPNETKSLLFGRLPVIEIPPSQSPIEDVIVAGKLPKRFMANVGERTFYVNTEGYSYCRYIVEIV